MQRKGSNLTSDELLGILDDTNKKEEKPKEIKWGDVEKFIQKEEILDGDTLVWGAIVYMKYKKTLPKYKKPLKYHTFTARFGLYYSKKTKADGAYYMLDPEPFDLSEESVWEARADRIRQREKRKKEKVKKKQ